MAWGLIGIAYEHLNRYNDAVEAYRQKIRINPNDAWAWYSIGLAYNLSGNKPAALSAVQELRRIDPTRAEELYSLIAPR